MGRGGMTDVMRYKPVRTTEDLEYQIALKKGKKRLRCSTCCKAFFLVCLTLLLIMVTAGLVAYFLYPDSVSILIKVIRAEVKETREKFFPRLLGKSGEESFLQGIGSHEDAMVVLHHGEMAVNTSEILKEPANNTFESDKYLLWKHSNQTGVAKKSVSMGRTRRPFPSTASDVENGTDVMIAPRMGMAKNQSTTPLPSKNDTDYDFEDDAVDDEDAKADAAREMEFFETFRPLASKFDRFVHSGAALMVALAACAVSVSVAAYFIILTCRRRRRLRRLERLSEELRNESNRFLIQHDDSDDDTDDRLSPKAITKKERVN